MVTYTLNKVTVMGILIVSKLRAVVYKFYGKVMIPDLGSLNDTDSVFLMEFEYCNCVNFFLRFNI